MVFNIAAGALNIKDKGNKVSYNSYALVATELAMIALDLTQFKYSKKSLNKAVESGIILTKHLKIVNLSMILKLVVYIVNIVYSSMVLDYYLNNKIIDDVLYNFSIAIVAINSITIFIHQSIFMSAAYQIFKQIQNLK